MSVFGCGFAQGFGMTELTCIATNMTRLSMSEPLRASRDCCSPPAARRWGPR